MSTHVVTSRPRGKVRVIYPALASPVNDWSFEGFVVLPPLLVHREETKRRMGVVVVGFRYADQPTPPYRLRIHVYDPILDGVLDLPVGAHVYCRGGFANAYTPKGVFTNLIATSVEVIPEGKLPAELGASALL